ncbi:MAG: DUF421 domain-containing protein [Ilumatobacteraceae bacterium]
MWFDTLGQVGRVLVAATIAYVAVVVLLRISGKRTLAKLSAFDLVVTIALGSTLATIALSSDVAIVEGLAAFVTLVVLQLVVAFATARSGWGRRLVEAQPTVVARDGRLLEDELRRQRLGADDVHQSIRAAGVGGLDQVAAVVLESDGSLSVIQQASRGSGDVLPM